ncbi:peroxisomal assembly protein [Actinomortierella ambigua]|uniref:Peroxisomal ATPase PEX6 n=1 Tax=Actinomortierella ambigua TaxID=1343610 RepID=A0A9P6U8W2_9FUNG|nr:peroxisomal assembly protein [Actinomortierella ambigua]
MPALEPNGPHRTSSSPSPACPVSQSHQGRLQARLSIRPLETLRGHNHPSITDSVQVTKPLWTKLWRHTSQGPLADSLPVSIVVSDEALASLQITAADQQAKTLLNTLVARATLLVSSIDGHVAEDADDECFISAEFASKYLPTVNFENPVTVGLQHTDLVVLDEVILAALSDEAYTAIAADPSLLSGHFLPAGREPVIIRYGQTYTLTGVDGEAYPVKVLMCNSVLQGVMEEETSIIFTDMAEEQSQQVEASMGGADLYLTGAMPPNHLWGHNTLHTEDPDELLDFNGDFIASQILAREHVDRPGKKNKKKKKNNVFKGLHFSVAELEEDDDDDDDDDDDENSQFNSTDDDDDDDDDDEHRRLAHGLDDSGDEIDGRKIRRALNGEGEGRGLLASRRHQRRLFADADSSNTAKSSSSSSKARTTAVEFTPWVLQATIPAAKLSPRPAPEDDPEARVFVEVSQLAKLRVFSGDWVIVSTNSDSNTTEGKHRFCRIFGLTLPPTAPPSSSTTTTTTTTMDETTSQLPRVYLPPSLHFNLGSPASSSSSSSTRTATVRIDAAKLPEDDLGVARAVTVARVASPATVDKALQGACLEALKQWFEAYERVVCEGDVIGVDVDEEVARIVPKAIGGASSNSNSSGENGTAASGGGGGDSSEVTLPLPASTMQTRIYFMLTHLEDAGLPGKHTQRVDPSMTKMIQSGLEHSRVPPRLRRHDRSPVVPSLDDPGAPAVFAKLHQLVSAGLHPYSSKLGLNCTVLLHGARGIGKRTAVEWVADLTGIHVMDVNCFDIASETEAKTEVAVRAKFEKAVACGPCVLLLRHIDALARKNVALETGQEPILSTVLKDCFTQLGESFKKMGHPVTVIATTGDIDKVPTSVLGCFLHEMSYDAPNEVQRLAILTNLTRHTPLGPDVSLNSLATQTAALVAKDLVSLVARAGLVAMDRVEKSIIVSAGVAVTAADFDSALNKARASYSDSIGAPKIPNVSWDDVGGLASVKNDILDTIQLPLEHPELFASGLKKRSGILLYGPPGTGKTLLAKAVATSCSLNFFSVKGPELLNMYIGESEANVRRVFQRARDAKPCVIFFDELDSVAPKRGEKGDSGGVMDRIVSQLLAELDGMNGSEGSGDVFVIGATNRPDLLDPALLRPGRFDKLLYLSVSTKHEEQLRIIQALTRKFRLHPDLDLRRVAERCPFNYTGADFYALCSDAMLKSMSRTAHTIEERVRQINAADPSSSSSSLLSSSDCPQVGSNRPPMTSQYYLDHLATPEEILVQVTETDFEQALRELVPSVSAQELEHYRQVQQMFNSDDFQREMEEAAKAEQEEEEEKNKKLRKEEQEQQDKEEEEEEKTMRLEQEKELRKKVEEAQRQMQAAAAAAKAQAQAQAQQAVALQAPRVQAVSEEQQPQQQQQQQQSQLPQQEERAPASAAADKGKGKGKARSDEPEVEEHHPRQLEEPIFIAPEDAARIRESLDTSVHASTLSSDGGHGHGQGQGQVQGQGGAGGGSSGRKGKGKGKGRR